MLDPTQALGTALTLPHSYAAIGILSSTSWYSGDCTHPLDAIAAPHNTFDPAEEDATAVGACLDLG